MTTDEIMVLADVYAEAERHDYLTGEGSVAAHRAALLNAVEALKADAELRELDGQASVGWLISYEYLASTENIDGSLKKFKENWIESSFLSEFKDADIDATKYRNRRETPLFTRPIPALTARTYMDGYSDGKAVLRELADEVEAHQARCGKAFEEGRDFQAQVESQLRRERDAALAKLEALEKQAPVGEAMPYSGKSADHTEAIFQKSIVPCGTKLYASPVPAKTLTDDQIRKALAAWFAKENESSGFEARMHAAIEAAMKGGA